MISRLTLLIADDSEYIGSIRDELESVASDIEVIDVDNPQYKHITPAAPVLLVYDPYYILDDRLPANQIIRTAINSAREFRYPIIALTNQTEAVLEMEDIRKGEHYDRLVPKSTYPGRIAHVLNVFIN